DTMADDNNKTNEQSTQHEEDTSRRKFLKDSGIAAGGVIGGFLLGGYFGNPFETEEASKDTDSKDKDKKAFTESRMFFTRFDDFSALEQATERIFPEDKNGPGAIELGVPYFIDKQLAGDF